LTISDWITYLSAEKHGAMGTAFSALAIIATLVSIFVVTNTAGKGIWAAIAYAIDGLIAAYLLARFYQVSLLPFIQRSKHATELLNKIMDGKFMTEEEIREEWRKLNKKEDKFTSKKRQSLEMTWAKWLWVAIFSLLGLAVITYFIGRGQHGLRGYDTNLFIGLASAFLSSAVSLFVVILTFFISRKQREKELSNLRFHFLRKKGTQLWEKYVEFCERLGVNAIPLGQRTWDTRDRTLWPTVSEANDLHQRLLTLIKGTTTVTNSPGFKLIELESAYEDISSSIIDTNIFEGEPTLANNLNEASKNFGWAKKAAYDCQNESGWTFANWPKISDALERTSLEVSKAIIILSKLAEKVSLN
jgi:hypothetical protein